jgi:cytochrome c oxidase assembly protein subunit 11
MSDHATASRPGADHADRVDRASNRITRTKLIVIVAVMFGFGFALVPFYKKICQAAGFWNLDQPDEVQAVNSQIDTSRTVTIELDANLHGDLPWQFKPEVVSIKAHPGELVHVAYDISNRTARDMVGQAIPDYAPRVAGRYFKKLECFCFARQTLHANETRRMPVVFVVDPGLPADVHTITLSYTFFEISNGVTAGSKG